MNDSSSDSEACKDGKTEECVKVVTTGFCMWTLWADAFFYYPAIYFPNTWPLLSMLNSILVYARMHKCAVSVYPTLAECISSCRHDLRLG